MFGAIELLGDEPSIPGQDGVGFGDTGDLLKCSPAEPLTNFSEGRSLGIQKAQTGAERLLGDSMKSMVSRVESTAR